MPPESMPIKANATTVSETLPEATFEIHRRIVPHVFGVAVCAVFVALWILERFRGIGAEFILSLGFSVFIFLFVMPVALLMAYLIINREPVVTVRGSCVHITSPTFAWRKTILPSGDIVSIDTDWHRNTSHARIVFCVTPKRFAEQRRSGPWIKRKNGKLYLDVLNTDFTPEEAAANLRRVLRIPDPNNVA